ncbi:hypothetical protein HPB47_001987 [Ixodes persulcatus]|uniref:Uncharacterized protein n=1 Tax=Ixodes persulcatus TaxID=34615 RepID=A0AC60PMY0_IXOPE|nr:hypothetical protein HPB47_001987 [Ixodes persulcatus]
MERRLAQAVGPVAPTSNATGRGPRTTRGRTATATTSRSACDATSFYLGATLLLSVASSMGLLVRFDGDQVSALARHQGLDVTRSRNVVRLGPSPYRGLPEALFLVNLQGGVHRICATLDDDDLAFLGDEAKLAPVGCISYYSISSADEDYRSGVDGHVSLTADVAADGRARALVRWPRRAELGRAAFPEFAPAGCAAKRPGHCKQMRNLAMSCSLVSLILMGASALVGGFGICKRQLSAVMVTGVMFILSVFTTCFMHFKRTVPQGVLTGTDFDRGVPTEFLRTDTPPCGWGIMLCVLTSVFWLVMARVMRF